MIHSRFALRTIGALALLIAAATGAPVQAGGLTRTVVGRADVSVPGREAVIAEVDAPAGARAGRHTHPGDEISFVTEGEVLLLVDGQPPRTLNVGDFFVIPAGVVHDAHNTSLAPARLIGVYMVEKGKPLTSPAPERMQAPRSPKPIVLPVRPIDPP